MYCTDLNATRTPNVAPTVAPTIQPTPAPTPVNCPMLYSTSTNPALNFLMFGDWG